MFREDATLGECELWLKELHHRSLENRGRETQLLNDVRRVLDSDFLQHGLRIERVDSEGLWLRHPNKTILPLADMSEGYRAAIAMLMDILRHLATVYGGPSLVDESNGRPVVQHSGVVLIDEVDSHLHPQWQRRVGFWLKKLLPNIQFIVTTHSPIICQAADRRGLFHLPAPDSGARPFAISDDDYDNIVRGKLDTIYLSPAFELTHTRSPEAVRAREQHARLRSKQASIGLSDDEKRQLNLFEWWVQDEVVAEER